MAGKKLKSILVELVNNKFLIRGAGSDLKRFFNGYESEGEPDYFITVTDEEIRREEIASIRRDRWKLTADQLELCAIQRKIVSALSGQGVLLFHGSAVCVDGRTYIFTAPSGTGKSTHSRLWREMLKNHDVVMVIARHRVDAKPHPVALTQRAVPRETHSATVISLRSKYLYGFLTNISADVCSHQNGGVKHSLFLQGFVAVIVDHHLSTNETGVVKTTLISLQITHE
jgi:hypothetical protein